MALFSRRQRAQTSIEYMLAIAMTIALVAVIMVSGFRELELDLALGAARMAGTDFAAKNASFSLGRIDVLQSSTNNTTVINPHFYVRGAAATGANLADAATMCFLKVQSVFSPGETSVSPDYCFDATYRHYCIVPQITQS
jgi:hypothetical protein